LTNIENVTEYTQMPHGSNLVFPLSLFASFCVLATAQPSLLTAPITDQKLIILKGHLHPLARTDFDQGPVAASVLMRSMTLLLRRSPAQQAELDQLLIDQQDPESAHYRQWLEPEDFAVRFGYSESDIARVKAWLEQQGFSIDNVPRSRNWVIFSGTATQVERAFHTPIHRYLVNGESHFANTWEPSVPADLAAVVSGIMGLNDFLPKPLARQQLIGPHPQNTNNGSHTLEPGDFAAIYDLNPLYQQNYNGAGQKIAIVGRCQISTSDVANFRTNAALPSSPIANYLQTVLPAGSANPGPNGAAGPEDCGEAYLDVEWAGGVAPGATIVYVYASDTITAAQWIVSNKLAPIMSMSFSACESKASSYGIVPTTYQAMAQQANSEGITWMVASGDSGAASCDAAFSSSNAAASLGESVSVLASPPEITAVGGSMFTEGSSTSTYWNSSNGTGGVSARQYIPEMGWNESGSSGLASSGGGLSQIFSKPSWQTGAGVPSQNWRAVPDVALSAAAHDGYLTYHDGNFYINSGTSAAAPSFAGIFAVLNQYWTAKGLTTFGQGNINPNLYRVAASAPTAFHDITSGNNIVSCSSGTANCAGGSFGYNAGAGYDMVTGLGSVDANNLVALWNNRTVNSTTTVNASPSSLALSTSTTLTATVKAAGSSTSPTGTVSFIVGSTAVASATLGGSGGTATASVTISASRIASAAGAYTITASYSGDSNFSGSSGAVAVTLTTTTANSAVVPSINPNPAYQQAADANGYTFFFTVTLTEVAGAPTTLTHFSFNGASYDSSIASFFGTTAIAAKGTLSAPLRAKGFTVPAAIPVVVGGTDGSGVQWTQQTTLLLYGTQLSAAMDMRSEPATVRQNPAAGSSCQWYQQVILEETNGHSVQLSKFLTGLNAGADLSSQIAAYFGSTTLPALGSLVAGICWSNITPPQTISYEVDGTDDTGQLITSTAKVIFDVAAGTGSVLSVGSSKLATSVSSAALSATAKLSVNVASGQQWSVSITPSNRSTAWLAASPQSGTGPGIVNFTTYGNPPNGSPLSPGTYNATLVVQSLNSLPQFINVPFTFTVGSAATPTVTAIANSASYASGRVSPGEIVAIFGTNLGPVQLANLTLTSAGLVSTNLAGTTVTFNGYPAPLWYTSAGQVAAIVPYEVSGSSSAQVVVTYQNVASAPFAVTVAPSVPGIFTANSSGTGLVSARNQDLTIHSPANPIVAGDVIVLYATGEGQTNPAGVDGLPANTVYPKPVLPVTVTIGNQPAQVGYAGGAPGFVAGAMQINATVPPSVNGIAVPITVQVGTAASAAGVTMAVATPAISITAKSTTAALIQGSNGPNYCGIPTAQTAFTSANSQVYVWLAFDGAHNGDILSFQWIHPSGTVDAFQPSTTLGFTGSGCAADPVNTAGFLLNDPGTWQAAVYINGAFLFALPFSVH
jgi:uncharacterized protein (TIGR03437 family)